MRIYSRSSTPSISYLGFVPNFELLLIRFSNPQNTGSIMLTAPIQRGLRELLSKNNYENSLTDLGMTPQTISSLYLPEPLLSIHSPCSKLVFSGDSIQQVDGAQPSKNHGRKPARNGFGTPNPGIQVDDNHATDGVGVVFDTSRDEPLKIIQPHPYSGPREIRYSSGIPGNSHKSRLRSQYDRRSSTRESRVPTITATNLPSSSDLSSDNYSPVISSQPQGKCDKEGGSLLNSGEVLRVMGHKPWGNKSLQYMILWKPLNSDVPTGLWVRATDFVESGKRAILEGYHLHHNLGPVRWPRDPRRQLRSSTSFGVQELKSALDERKQILLDRGVDELEASREMNLERWKMRDEWQRAGRGWGSAMMIVEDRKKAWSVADSDAEELLMADAKFHNIHPRTKSPESSSSDFVAMMKAAGMLDSDTYQEQNSELFDSSLPTSPPNIPKPSNHRHPKKTSEEAKNQFRFTSEDEREWREIFGPELVRSSVSAFQTLGNFPANACR